MKCYYGNKSGVHYVIGKVNILANEKQRVRWQQTFPTNEIQNTDTL